MLRSLTQIFLKGLTIVLPVVVGIYVTVWLLGGLEESIGAALQAVLPEGVYLPGMGVALALVLIFLAGLLMYPWLTRKLFEGLDALLRRIPFFASIYSPVRDLMDFVGGSMDTQLGKPVMVRVPNTEMDTLGFITREHDPEGGGGMIPEGHKAVYVQWSSQIGGYCFIVPEESIRPLDISVEDGMRWALTAGLSGPADRKGKAATGSDKSEEEPT